MTTTNDRTTAVQIREHEFQLRDVDFGRSSLVVRLGMGGYEPLPAEQLRQEDIEFARLIWCDWIGCGQVGLRLECYAKAHSRLTYLTCPTCGAVREIVWPNQAPEGAVVL